MLCFVSSFSATSHVGCSSIKFFLWKSKSGSHRYRNKNRNFDSYDPIFLSRRDRKESWYIMNAVASECEPIGLSRSRTVTDYFCGLICNFVICYPIRQRRFLATCIYCGTTVGRIIGNCSFPSPESTVGRYSMSPVKQVYHDGRTGSIVQVIEFRALGPTAEPKPSQTYFLFVT